MKANLSRSVFPVCRKKFVGWQAALKPEMGWSHVETLCLSKADYGFWNARMGLSSSSEGPQSTRISKSSGIPNNMSWTFWAHDLPSTPLPPYREWQTCFCSLESQAVVDANLAWGCPWQLPKSNLWRISDCKILLQSEKHHNWTALYSNEDFQYSREEWILPAITHSPREASWGSHCERDRWS